MKARYGRLLSRNYWRAISRADREILCSYGRGQIPRRAAMGALGLRDYGELLALLSRARVPIPLVSIDLRREMVARTVEMLSRPSRP
ncbi:hypothetical protein [Pseudaquabacterium pictum]|uniref:Uncharacterized protein n=1 Tax=Pseudaquabacterium pictum TaxID=2315236 RepID=A0A480AY42_9BURK|nr:hypothetical protein [Rubrivivax pictus]GCL66364.1 hypothetical protein AQPW35_54450 [Rubrivivax pictus]